MTLEDLRAILCAAYSDSTANGGSTDTCVRSVRSRGQCAVTALLLNSWFGWGLRSATVQGESHWFNSVPTPEGDIEVDLTGDQFGLAPVQVAFRGALYPRARDRARADANEETMARLEVLRNRVTHKLRFGPPQVQLPAISELGSRIPHLNQSKAAPGRFDFTPRSS